MKQEDSQDPYTFEALCYERYAEEQKQMNQIEVYNLSKLPTADFEDFLELQEDFKMDDPERNVKLQNLILTRGFKYSFKAWRDSDGKLWIIDAHQRKKALHKLRSSGFLIPPIPYELIYARTKKEAVEEIAAYNSSFAEKNPDTILFKKYNIDHETLDHFELKMAEFDLSREEVETPTVVNEEESNSSVTGASQEIDIDSMDDKMRLTFILSEEEYWAVRNALELIAKTPETALLNILNIEL